MGLYDYLLSGNLFGGPGALGGYLDPSQQAGAARRGLLGAGAALLGNIGDPAQGLSQAFLAGPQAYQQSLAQAAQFQREQEEQNLRRQYQGAQLKYWEDSRKPQPRQPTAAEVSAGIKAASRKEMLAGVREMVPEDVYRRLQLLALPDLQSQVKALLFPEASEPNDPSYRIFKDSETGDLVYAPSDPSQGLVRREGVLTPRSEEADEPEDLRKEVRAEVGKLASLVQAYRKADPDERGSLMDFLNVPAELREGFGVIETEFGSSGATPQPEKVRDFLVRLARHNVEQVFGQPVGGVGSAASAAAEAPPDIPPELSSVLPPEAWAIPGLVDQIRADLARGMSPAEILQMIQEGLGG